jgi:filamentous hemagglutinin family protein
VKGRLRASFAASAAFAAWATPCIAQTGTNIVPDTAQGLSTGTAVQTFGPNHFIVGGKLEGANLFHSFSFFDLAKGNAAVWARLEGDGNSIQNVINRVTGGSASRIDGVLTTFGMPNADFYFINPAGIMFGTGVSINVPNAAYFSAGHELRFADGARFSAATPGGSVFTAAAPQAFGFLGRQGAIAISGGNADSFAPATTRLSFSGGTVSVESSSIFAAGIDLFATTGPAALSISDPGSFPAESGSIRVSNSFLLGLPGGAGTGSIRFAAGDIAIEGSTAQSIHGSDLGAGNLDFRGRTLSLTNKSFVASVTGSEAPGGSINVAAENMLVSDSLLFVGTQGAGNSGDLTIKTGGLLVTNGGAVGAQGRPGATGALGTVLVEAENVALTDRGIISSLSFGSADSGTVGVSAKSLLIDSGGIQSVTFGTGDAGGVLVAVEGPLAISNSGFIQSSAAATSSGSSGFVLVDAQDIAVESGGKISATTSGEGDAGGVQVSSSRSLRIASGGFISSDAESLSPTASAGLVVIRTPSLLLDGGSISTRSVGGDAGAIDIEVPSVRLINGSSIASTAGGVGNAGAVGISATELILDSNSNIDSSTVGEGDGGVVLVSAKSVNIMNGAGISAVTLGPGPGGGVLMETGTLSLASGGYIITSAQGTGAAGGVIIKADQINMANGVITAATAGAGDGGVVAIEAKKITIEDGGIISSDTLGGTGNAGAVAVVADELSISGVAGITATSSGPGNAGQIAVQAGKLSMNAGIISSQTRGTGDAGDVLVKGTDLSLTNGARISSSAASLDPQGLTGGASGSVELEAATLSLAEGASIETTSANVNPAGSVSIAAGQLSMAGAEIGSENLSAAGGPAGSVSITADEVRVFEGGSISTNSVAGAAGDITLLLPAGGRLQLEGAGAPGVITTSSGPGTGGRITISNPYLILSHGGRILALGEEGGANVALQSSFFIRSADRLNEVSVNGSLVLDTQVGDLSSGIEAEDVSFLDASSVLRGQCPASGSSGVSQFSTRSIGPYSGLTPAKPDPAQTRRQVTALLDARLCL